MGQNAITKFLNTHSNILMEQRCSVKADAYWLLDLIESISRHYKRMHEDFIIIDLIVAEDDKASITVEDTKGIFFKQGFS